MPCINIDSFKLVTPYLVPRTISLSHIKDELISIICIAQHAEKAWNALTLATSNSMTAELKTKN